MAIQIADSIFDTFPDVAIGIIIARKIDNSSESTEVIDRLHQEQSKIIERFFSVAVSEHPQIVPWREAYRKFGAKPKDYPSSVENLIKRVTKGYSLPHINMLVDLYNTISLRYVVPAGGEDLDKIEGNIHLTFATDHEVSVRLLGKTEERPPKNGEVIYKDNISAICRRWNWKEADRTKLTKETKNAILVIEALPPVDRAQLEHILQELSALIFEYCGGDISSGILDPSNRLYEFPNH